MATTFTRSNKKWIIPVTHLLGWLIFFSIPFFSHNSHRDEFRPTLGHSRIFSDSLTYFDTVVINSPHTIGAPFNMPMLGMDLMLYCEIILGLALVIIFYLNIFIIASFFVTKKKYTQYLGLQILVGIIFYVVMRLTGIIILPMANMMPIGMHIFNYIIIVLASLCYSLVNENIRVERLQKEKENETLRSELLFLRWQISPHFLFNVLNNLVSLAHIKSEKLEGMLFSLSNLMRYMLYENDGDHKISIESETLYLQSYIDLQNLRFGNDISLISNVFIEENNEINRVIEPMLLIPFIENAFKHGIGAIENPTIDIDVHFRNAFLTMTVKNKYRKIPDSEVDNTKGIGLLNVKKRLNLLYPGKHSLTVSKNDGWYISTLGINLL